MYWIYWNKIMEKIIIGHITCIYTYLAMISIFFFCNVHLYVKSVVWFQCYLLKYLMVNWQRWKTDVNLNGLKSLDLYGTYFITWLLMYPQGPTTSFFFKLQGKLAILKMFLSDHCMWGVLLRTRSWNWP